MKPAWGFGIVPSTELRDAGRMMFEELCERASNAAGVRFVPTIASGYRDLIEGLSDGTLGVAWLPPLPVIDLLEDGKIASPLVVPARRGLTTFHSALLVRRGGPKTIEALEGRRAAWVEGGSAAGYLVPRMQLAARGFDVGRFFGRELFLPSHGDVVNAVASGQADVGASYCHLENDGKTIQSGAWTDDDGRPLRPIEALATFGPIPNDAVVASNAMSASARASLTRWLLALDPRGRAVFDRVIGATDFRVASREHFEPLRHLLRAARARGFDALPPESRLALRVAKRV